MRDFFLKGAMCVLRTSKVLRLFFPIIVEGSCTVSAMTSVGGGDAAAFSAW